MRLSFLVCPSYHGATLLALLLNNHSRISALGDTNPTREYDQICACRERVSACEFWTAIREQVETDRFSDMTTLLPTLPRPLANYHLEGDQIAVTGIAVVDRAAGRAAATGADWLTKLMWRPNTPAINEYVGVWRRFYETVTALHGTAVVVDGSKGSRKVGAMGRGLEAGAEISVIHLVRDPRGFVASARRYNQDHDIRALGYRWAALHKRMERLASVAPYLRVRYEDLAVRPAEEVTSVLRLLGVETEEVIAPPRYPHKHHLMGNAMLASFNGEVAVDERWRQELTPAEQATALRCAGAVATRFGYR